MNLRLNQLILLKIFFPMLPYLVLTCMVHFCLLQLSISVVFVLTLAISLEIIFLLQISNSNSQLLILLVLKLKLLKHHKLKKIPLSLSPCEQRELGGSKIY